MAEKLVLKWGSVKSWDVESDEALAAIGKWRSHGHSGSAATHVDSDQQRQDLLAVIDLMDEIFLDWESKEVTREEAKEYVINYWDWEE